MARTTARTGTTTAAEPTLGVDPSASNADSFGTPWAAGRQAFRTVPEQVRAPQVDRVPALVGTRRLHDERGPRQSRVPQERAQAERPDQPRPHVLVPIRARPERRSRVIQVDERQPIQADQRIEAVDHVRRSLGASTRRSRRPTGAPCRGRMRADRSPPTVRRLPGLSPAPRAASRACRRRPMSSRAPAGPMEATPPVPRARCRRSVAGRPRLPPPRCDPIWVFTRVAP